MRRILMSYRAIMENMALEPQFKEYVRKQEDQQLHLLGLDQLDPFLFQKKYFEMRPIDASTDRSANIAGRSPANYYYEQTKSYESLMCFQDLMLKGKELFGDFSLDNFMSGALYFHHKSKYKLPYCQGLTTTNILLNGQPFGQLESSPPKNLHSLVAQIREYMMIASHQSSGAVAPTDMPVMMGYILKDETDKQIENYYQSFVHTMNKEFRSGGESPFTNVMISSMGPYEKMFDDFVFPDGRTITDLVDEIERVNAVILNFMMKGDPRRGGMPYKFPIHTLQVTKSDVESEMFEEFAIKNKFGHFNVNQTEQFSMCCRFAPDQKDEIFKTGYFGGGGGMQLGSHRVVTINLPWVAHECERTGKDPLELIEELHEDAAKALVTHKMLLKDKFIPAHFLLLFDIGWLHLKQLYSTVGFIGLPEYLSILMGSYTSKDARALSAKTLSLLNALNYKATKKYTEMMEMSIKFNLEEIPGEDSAMTLAEFSNSRFGTNDDIYSNQFVPLSADVPLQERLAIESEMSGIITGGSMTHINLLDPMDEETSILMHKRIVGQTNVSQFAFNYGWSTCDRCKRVELGMIDTCNCGNKMRHWTRIVGYFVPVDNWSKARQKELGTRRWYTI